MLVSVVSFYSGHHTIRWRRICCQCNYWLAHVTSREPFTHQRAMQLKNTRTAALVVTYNIRECLIASTYLMWPKRLTEKTCFLFAQSSWSKLTGMSESLEAFITDSQSLLRVIHSPITNCHEILRHSAQGSAVPTATTSHWRNILHHFAACKQPTCFKTCRNMLQDKTCSQSY